MANFDRRGMTQAGINLMGKAIGGATIQFTKFVLGDGEMTGEILDLQGVVSPKQNVDVTRIERNDNQCTVGGELLTKSVKQGFFWRECGLYAMDPDVGEILYNYAYSTKPDYIASSDSGMMEEILVSMIATVGSNTNVEVTIDSSMVFVTNKQFELLNTIKVNVKQFGAIGDGIINDTDAIKKAICYLQENNGGTLFFPSGTYIIDAHDETKDGVEVHKIGFSGGILVPSNITIEGQNKGSTILKCTDKSKSGYNLIRIFDVENVTVKNLTLIGDLESHTGTTGQFGHGIMIMNSHNVKIKDCIFKDLWGDGIYVGILFGNNSSKQNKDIVIEDCIVDKASRDGISICSVDGITIRNFVAKNISRTFPKSAILFECEGDKSPGTNAFIDNVVIDNVYSEENAYGITINITAKQQEKLNKFKISNVTVKGGSMGIYATSLAENKVEGIIEINNVKCYATTWNGVKIAKYINTHPVLKFKDVYIENNCDNQQSDNYTGWCNGGGFIVVRNSDATQTAPIGNVIVENLEIVDNRDTMLTSTSFICIDQKNMKPTNVKLINPIRLDSLYNIFMQNVSVKDTNLVCAFNIAYSDTEFSNQYPRGVVYSSGASPHRLVAINSDVVSGNKVVLINDSSKKFYVQLDKFGSSVKIHPFENTHKYLVTSQQGATMTIQKIGNEFYATNVVGTWELTDSL